MLVFDNNAQIAMTNDASNTTRHRIVFESGASSTHTVSGSTANLFVAVDEQSPMIQNKSSVVQTLAFPIEVGDDGLIVDTVNGVLNVTGTISGSGTITKIGGGAGGISGQPQNVVVTANNTGFTGKWVVTGGNLSINGDGALGAVPGSAVSDAITLNGGSLTNMSRPSGGGFGAGHGFTLNENRGITLGANGGNIRIGYTQTLTIEGAITGTGRLSLSDNGILVLNNANNTYQGGTRLTGTTSLQITDDACLGALPGVFTANSIALSGEVTLSNHSSADVVINANRGITIGSGSRLSSQGAGRSLTVDSIISGSGGLTIASGSGAVVLTAANTYSGGTTIASGARLSLGNGGAAGSVTGNIANEGILTMNRSDEWSFGGVISGSGSLVKTGSGVLQLTGANTYTGKTSVNEGVLRIANDAALGAAPAAYVADHLVLDGGRLMNLDSDLAIAATRGVSLGAAGGQLQASWSKSLTIESIISGAGGLTVVDDSGTVVLSGANTYGGATSVNAALKLEGGDNRLPVGASIALADAARAALDLGGANQTVRWLTGGGSNGGSIINSGTTTSTLTLNLGSSGVRTLSGTIDGDIQVVVANSSGKNSDVQVFSNTNSYTGGTVVDNGHLRVASDSYLGAVPDTFDADNIVLKNGGVLQNNDGYLVLDANRGILLEEGDGVFYTGWNLDITANGVISGPGRLVKADNGRLILTAANKFTGDTALRYYASGPRTIVLQNEAALQYSTFDATIIGGTSGCALDLDDRDIILGGLKGAGAGINNFTGQLSVGNNNQDTEFSGTLTGAGSLVKIGTGTLSLAGDNSYTGTTTVDAGALVVNGALSGTSAVRVNSGGVLGGTGVVNATVGGAGLVAPGASPGILTVTQVDPTESLGFAFEFTGVGNPVWSAAEASINDVLRITDAATPFAAALTTDNIVNVYLDVADVTAGDSFLGGFYTDATEDFIDSIDDEVATYNYYIRGDGNGNAVTYNGKSYYSLDDWKSWVWMELSTPTVALADFATGNVLNGRASQFSVVPEPGACLPALLAMTILLAWRRR